jgi:hypothetical protein
MRQFRSPSRWTWALLVMATAFIAACDTSLEGINQQQTWGFITVAATQDASDAHFADVEGLFFEGNFLSVPNSDFEADTCFDGGFSPGGNSLPGVTHLDAGEVVTATIGGVENLLERTATIDGLAYLPPSPISYTPGDSIVVDIPGAPGGFPSGNIRAKTAEAFTFPAIIDPPAGTEAIQLNWSEPESPEGSVLVVSLRYATEASPSLNRQVLCNFKDDGIDSIPFRWHQTWSASSGERAVVATRLRTNYVVAGDANLGVISTYEFPPPRIP